MTFLKKFSLFSYKAKVVLADPTLSLLQNFTNLCRLPFYKPRSIATQRLIAVIKTCQCLSLQNTTYSHFKDQQQLLTDIANLELIKDSIGQWQNWHKIHHKTSARANAITKFNNAIIDWQTQLLRAYDNLQFLKRRKEIIPSWHSPLVILNDHKTYINLLTPCQRQAYQSLKALNTASQEKKYMPSCLAVFMSLMNLFDLDISVLLDGLDISLEMYNFII